MHLLVMKSQKWKKKKTKKSSIQLESDPWSSSFQAGRPHELPFLIKGQRGGIR